MYHLLVLFNSYLLELHIMKFNIINIIYIKIILYYFLYLMITNIIKYFINIQGTFYIVRNYRQRYQRWNLVRPKYDHRIIQSIADYE